jgi:butyrate kinase
VGTKLFVINPGSTSTKVALFEDERILFEKTVRHDVNEIKSFPSVMAQYEYRLKTIKTILLDNRIDPAEIDAFVGRGGLLKPLSGGTYLVNNKMLEDLKAARYGEHASNLGAIIAFDFAQKHGKNAYIVNPVVVDELMDIARITGLPEMQNISIFHALNQKAVAKRACNEMGIDYRSARLIVAHLGGGISVGVHENGKVIDVNNALEDGPFTPERAGTLPMKQVIELCYSGKYTKKELMRKLIGNSGLIAHTGTSDCRVLVEKAETDDNVRLVLEAMLYRISREICAGAAALYGNIDSILITGGLAYSDYIVDRIKRRVSFLAPVRVYPGEDEMMALAQGVLDVINGSEALLEYTEE